MALPFPRPAALSPSFTLSRCTPDDIPQMISVYIAAFRQTAFDYWWPDSLEPLRQWNEVRFRRRFRDPTDQQFKIVDSENGQMVAFIRWIIPEEMKGMAEGFSTYDDKGDAESVAMEDELVKKPPAGSNEEMFREFFLGTKSMNEKWEANKKLDLSLLCTHPAYQRRGIAAALIQSVLAIADAEGFTTYVDALDNATPVYERYGFKTVDRSVYDLTRAGRQGSAVVNIMLREPRTSDVDGA